MAEHAETLLPLGLRLRDRRVVVVGGGRVALRRVGALLQARAVVTVVSPDVVAALEDLALRGKVEWQPRFYADGDLEGAWLAMACTADAEVNAAVLREAEARRVFCLRVDDARDASAWMPATGRSGPATVSVHGDRNPRRAAALRDAAVAAVDEALRDDPGAPARTPLRDDTPGRVILVGGGPGDPELLTLKGFQALATADVVVVDRLAPLAVLDGLREGVEVVDVSKIPRGRFTPQEEINAVLVDRALRGLTVVRLKGGDSFVFGRGMEEVLACAEAGVATEVVPGVTSAIAAPELAGIPVTHRGLSQGFTVISGHAAPGDPRSTVDWEALARGGTTLVVLMGVETLAAIAAALVAAGRDADTPLASVMDGGLPTQAVLSSTLGAVAKDGPPDGLRPPAVTVIGPVAGFAAG
ncbi:uroporphyrinogen-III C-methyltransferase [Oryzihumus sp.]|uniref:uroporphyrinogen-III C-methyltransferase n=1 Tax=Oryzihumus sp. TaxID=1968903 RepID=UPI002ED7C385